MHRQCSRPGDAGTLVPMSRRADRNRTPRHKPAAAPLDHTPLMTALRQLEIAVDGFNREAARIETEYGIAIYPERVGNMHTDLARYIEVAIGIVARKLPVAVYGADSRRWTGPQTPRQVFALYEAAGDNTADYLTQMALNAERIKGQEGRPRPQPQAEVPAAEDEREAVSDAAAVPGRGRPPGRFRLLAPRHRRGEARARKVAHHH